MNLEFLRYVQYGTKPTKKIESCVVYGLAGNSGKRSFNLFVLVWWHSYPKKVSMSLNFKISVWRWSQCQMKSETFFLWHNRRCYKNHQPYHWQYWNRRTDRRGSRTAHHRVGIEEKLQLANSPIQGKYIKRISNEFRELFKRKIVNKTCEVATHFHHPFRQYDLKASESLSMFWRRLRRQLKTCLKRDTTLSKENVRRIVSFWLTPWQQNETGPWN